MTLAISAIVNLNDSMGDRQNGGVRKCNKVMTNLLTVFANKRLLL